MAEVLNPKFIINSLNTSIFGYTIEIEIGDLPPNEIFEIRDFGPDGEALSGHIGLKSDINGNLVPSPGSRIGFGHTFSKPMMKGDYIIGIMKGEFKHDKKLWFDEWKKSPNPKSFTTFHFDYSVQPFLSINSKDKVPWGTPIKVSGELWYKGQNFPWCSGATDMQGRQIVIAGNDINEINTLTDAFSKFSTEIQVGNSPQFDCYIQAHYEGDPIFFDKCESERVYYEIIKHRTGLEIEIDDLKLKATKSVIGYPGKANLESGQPFRIKCTLVDYELNGAIEGKVVKLDTDLGPKPIECVTEADGSFVLDKLYAPHGAREYRIDVSFEGDYLYDPCNSRLEVVTSEKKINPINIDASESSSDLITPDKPFSNEEKIRRILRSCTGYVNWIDNYYRTAGLEWLNSEINRESVKDIRILTAKESASDDLRAYFKRFKEEMSTYGIKCQMKVLVDPKIKSQIHDRWILSQEKNYIVPSVDVIKRGQYSEIKETESAIPFDEWWRKGVDIIGDWNKITEVNETTVKKVQSPASSDPRYSQPENKLNELVFKKLRSLSINMEPNFLITLGTNDDRYDQIPYIQHAENALRKYKNIHDALVATKTVVEKYNVYSAQLSEIISSFIQTQMKEKYPHLNISDKTNLDAPSSYSGPNFLEMTFDFVKNKDNSEIIRFEKSNFESSANVSFGWVLHRINRVSGIMTADIILTSYNQVDTEPQRVLSMLKGIKDNEQANGLIDEMTKNVADLEKKIQNFTFEIKRLSECIDLDVSYGE